MLLQIARPSVLEIRRAINHWFLRPCKFYSRIISFLQTRIVIQDPKICIYDSKIGMIGCALWSHSAKVASDMITLDQMFSMLEVILLLL